MQTKWYVAWITIVLLVLSIQSSSIATIKEVPPLTELVSFITGDTTATGQHPNTEYGLQRGATYFTLGWLITKIPLKFVAIGDPSLDRPFVKILVNAAGASTPYTFLINKNITFEGIRFNGTDILGGLKEGIVYTLSPNLKIIAKNCQFDSIGSAIFDVRNNNCDVFVTDCLCFDLGNGNFGGRVVDGRSTQMDSLILVNNTIYSTIHCVLNKFGGWEKYIKFDHNTVYNLVRCPLRIVQCPDLTVTNNLFIQTGICGYHVKYKYGPEGYTEPTYAYTSRDRFTRIELLPATADTFKHSGLTQKCKFINNNFWIDPAIDAALPDSGLPYMTIDFDTAKAVIGKDTLTWISENPGFKKVPDVRGQAMAITNLTGGNMYVNPGLATGGQPYNFSYPTTARSYTAAEGGFPLGDLNWFPDKKAQWEQYTPVQCTPLAVIKADANGDFVPDTKGQTVTVCGVVTTPNYRPGGIQYYMQDETAGINLFASNVAFEFNIGDVVQITGKIDHYRGLTEIIPQKLEDIKVTGKQAPPAPLWAFYEADLNEATEGMLVNMHNCKIVDPSKWPLAGKDATVKFIRGADTIDVFIDKDMDLAGSPAPEGMVDIIGVVEQYTTKVPPDNGYEIRPRSQADFKTSTQVIGQDPNLPDHYALQQNYPNPFNPVTTVSFDMPENAEVQIRVYDLLGRVVATLYEGKLEAGYHKFTFNAIDLPSGVYFYRAECKNFVAAKKMTLVK